MLLVRKYRQWVAALLLAVYTFITVPAQLWHQHHPPAGKKTFTQKASGGQYLLVAKAKLSADDCAVCHHKYSAYTDYHYTPTPAPVIIYSNYSQNRCTSLYYTAHFYFSNKSPPAIA